MSCFSPFCRKTALTAIAALVLLTPSARAQSAQPIQQAAISEARPEAAKPEAAKPEAAKPEAAKSEAAKPPASQTTGTGTVAAVDPANSSPPKSLTAKAIDTVKQVAKSAGDIFSRVPCLPPKGVARSMGSLPHVAGKLASGQPVVIIAFGSSTTTSFGVSSPEFAYPSRLAAQLRRQYPGAEINVIVRGKGGEDAPEMMKRLQAEVIDVKPDLVIWQVGTNAVLRNLDPGETTSLVEDGVGRLQAAGADVVLVDPQYSPRVNEHPESAGKMVRLLGKVAELRHIGIFPRFEVMREWHEQQALPIDTFVIADGLHMNDWGYACFAQLLGDDIIRSVGQIKLGINVPADVQANRPM